MSPERPPIPDFRTPIMVRMWLDCALEMERKKHDAVPIQPDLSADWEAAQAWAYITTAYVIAEQALKALVHYTVGFDEERGGLRGTHRLCGLFDSLSSADKRTLNDLYEDYFLVQRADRQGVQQRDVRSFLDHLDKGRGSVGWRYSIAEAAEAREIPRLWHMHLRILWEFIRCAKEVLHQRTSEDGYSPRPYSAVWREERFHAYYDWSFHKLNSEDDWVSRDRIELLWGPDPAGKTDFMVVRDRGFTFSFGDPEAAQAQLGIGIVDSRAEVAEVAGPMNPAFT